MDDFDFDSDSGDEAGDTTPDEELRRKKKEITEFLNTKEQANVIRLKQADTKHIIFVGKSRNGKSTALQILKDPFSFVGPGSLYADTVDAEISHFTVEVKNKKKEARNFNISIIDTPGLFEVKDIGTSRDNEVLESIVLKCMNAEITKIHAIFFVISSSGAGVNPQDIEALGRFIKLFHGAEKNVYLLITKAENLDKDTKKKLKNDLFNYPGMKEKLSLINPNVLFTGAVEQSDIDNGFADVVKYKMKNVLSMRRLLFSTIFKLQEPFRLGALEMADSVRVKAQELKIKLEKLFNENRGEIKDIKDLKAKAKKLTNWSNFMNADDKNPTRSLCDAIGGFIEVVEFGRILDAQMKSFSKNPESVKILKQKIELYKGSITVLDTVRRKEAQERITKAMGLIA